MADDIRVAAFLHATPGNQDMVRRAALDCVEPTRAEPGNLAYDLTVDAQDPTLFVFVEHWESQAALEAHRQTPHYKALGTALGDALAFPPIVHVLRPV